MNPKETNKKRQLTGTVVSDKMDKTRVVEISRSKKHPRYEKYFNVSTRFKAHDETNQYKTGDKVVIEETRPLSKDKKWKIVKLVEAARKAEALPEVNEELK
jgi:small subunit ribosomal protein S17